MSPLTPLAQQTRGALSVHVFEGLDIDSLDLFVTDRFDGVSTGPYESLNLGDHVGDDRASVGENRRRVAIAAAVALDDLVFVTQNHGCGVVDVDACGPQSVGDVVVLRGVARAAAIMVADCAPIAIIDQRAHCAVIIHAGWRGLAQSIIERVVAQFDRPRELIAAVGPCISMENYQIGPEVAERFSSISGAVIADVGGRSRLCLRTVIRQQLEQLAVSASNIWVSSQVTDGGELFFSDRSQRPCGRFAMVAKWSS